MSESATYPSEVPKKSLFSYPTHLTLKVHCGCGLSLVSIGEGVQHAESTGHTLHITGEIRAQKD